MKFCSNCGHAVSRRIPPDDNRERDVCDNCGAIHYENPRNVVGTVPVLEDKVLLCKRAIEPRYGYWTLPAGFMELGETTTQGAARETLEESGAHVEVGELFTVLNVPHVHQVHLFYLAKMLAPDFAPSEESLEVKLVAEAGIPWQELAFPTIHHTLKLFFQDRAEGRLGDGRPRVHQLDINRPMRLAAPAANLDGAASPSSASAPAYGA
ncbi:MAG: NUDIX hydrolase [Candidatus Protistobacter heckmanni]|nr:NUDIX hydrolase [Candidatus Protistobacter heckmanni]